MLNEIIALLGENYNTADEEVLRGILDKTTSNALFISNRTDTVENRELLKPEIEDSVISQYLRRGSEDAVSASQSGISASYIDYREKLRNDIVKNGKRVLR